MATETEEGKGGLRPTQAHPTTAPERLRGLSRAQLLALPSFVSLPTAARALGIGRSSAYELARRGRFPCRVVTVGRGYRVATEDLRRLAGIDPDSAPVPDVPSSLVTAPPGHVSAGTWTAGRCPTCYVRLHRRRDHMAW
ncbi:helix-turn-helix domain-containing protein [Kitasatospora sp. NPDC006697]|uniref:helix-turn-helix domain-containing protein n=1 Tax=Kitasatospora sp. NPDC006697 TaxID=3364020 RepID=UPI0036B8BA54